MNKQEILQVIRDERSTHEAWSQQGSIIEGAINLENLIEPIDYEDSNLYQWLKNNKSSICAFSWYKELKQVHVKAHYSYVDLFEDATRKYNPKTRDQLIESFELVRQDLFEFNTTLDQIEESIDNMSDTLYIDFVLKSNAAARKHDESLDLPKPIFVPENQDAEDTTNTVEISNHEEVTIYTDDINETGIDSITNEMSPIDIVDYNDNKAVEIHNEVFTDPVGAIENTLSPLINTEENAKLKDEYNLLKSDLKTKDTLDRYITLKEQNIQRLNQEKELIEQEFTHLEEAQKLSQQGLDQIEQHVKLKQEEIELEQLDSEKLLETNTIERDKAKAKLDEIERDQQALKNEIIDLEQENIKDELLQEDYKNTPLIDDQYDAIINNKAEDIEALRKSLSNKSSDLIALKQQVSALEKEVANIENDIELKQKSIDELEEKEQTKNQERSLGYEATLTLIKKRNETINSNNSKLDILTTEYNDTKAEFDALNIKFVKMKQTIFSLSDINDAELDEIEAQQVRKQKRYADIYTQKLSKQKEIDGIDARLDEANKALSQLKDELQDLSEQKPESSL